MRAPKLNRELAKLFFTFANETMVEPSVPEASAIMDIERATKDDCCWLRHILFDILKGATVKINRFYMQRNVST